MKIEIIEVNFCNCLFGISLAENFKRFWKVFEDVLRYLDVKDICYVFCDLVPFV